MKNKYETILNIQLYVINKIIKIIKIIDKLFLLSKYTINNYLFNKSQKKRCCKSP